MPNSVEPEDGAVSCRQAGGAGRARRTVGYVALNVLCVALMGILAIWAA